MVFNKNKEEIIELLAQHEKTIGQLYQEFANKFSDWENFWLELSAEEVQHARWILKLNSKAEEGTAYFKMDRFNVEAINTSIRYINNQLSKVRSEEISLKEALNIAQDLENGLIEKKYFEIFSGDSEEVKQILIDLKTATIKHLGKVQRAWSETR